MANLQDFKDDLAREAHGMTTAEAQSKGICINCKEPALPKCYSDAGRGEYRISGMCEYWLEQVQAELKRIKRNAKKNGLMTRSQAFNRG